MTDSSDIMVMAKQWRRVLCGLSDFNLLCFVVASFAAADAKGETIVFGTSKSNNIIPFGAQYVGDTYRTFAGMQYVQIYDGSGFGNAPFLISDIGFVSIHLQSGRDVIPVTYSLEISLAYTGRSTTAEGTQVDGPFTPVYSGTKSAVLTETRGDFDLVFQLPVPFEYDSANGNLALKVLIGAVVFDTSTSTNGFAFEAGISPLVARDVGSFQPQFGLVTGFSADGKFPLYGVPEPSVISSLFTLGLVSIGLARMRRKRSR